MSMNLWQTKCRLYCAVGRVVTSQELVVGKEHEEVASAVVSSIVSTHAHDCHFEWNVPHIVDRGQIVHIAVNNVTPPLGEH